MQGTFVQRESCVIYSGLVDCLSGCFAGTLELGLACIWSILFILYAIRGQSHRQGRNVVKKLDYVNIFI